MLASNQSLDANSLTTRPLDGLCCGRATWLRIGKTGSALFSMNDDLIMACKRCSQKNRIVETNQRGLWRCAKCKAELLHSMSRPGEKLLSNCKVELQSCLDEIQKMNGIFRNSRKIEAIKSRVSQCKSQIDSWKIHLTYSVNATERKIVSRYHASDLNQVNAMFSDLDEVIDSKDWLKRFIEYSETGRRVVSTLADIAGLVGDVMWLCGVPNGLSQIASKLDSRLSAS